MKQKKGFELRRVGNEEIIVASGIENIDFSRIISMNSSSAWLWKQLEGKYFTPQALAELLTKHYDIDSVVALNDAKEITQQWLKAGIVE